MALAININDLLNKQKIESNRIEFKKGWNPAVYIIAYVLSLMILMTLVAATLWLVLIQTRIQALPFARLRDSGRED